MSDWAALVCPHKKKFRSHIYIWSIRRSKCEHQSLLSDFTCWAFLFESLWFFYPSVRGGALGVQRRQYNSTSDQSASCSQNSKTNQPAFLELWKSFPKRCFLGGRSLWSYEARLPCWRKVRLCEYHWKESSCVQVLLSERMILEIDPFLVLVQVSRVMLSLASSSVREILISVGEILILARKLIHFWWFKCLE